MAPSSRPCNRQLDGFTLTAGAADPFGVQDRLVGWAIDALQLSVDGAEQAALAARGTQATDAYACALQGLGYLLDYHWATHVWLANFHRSRGRYADAAREYEQAIALTPDNAPVRGILAGTYMFLGRYDDAVLECRRSLAIAPSYITYVSRASS